MKKAVKAIIAASAVAAVVGVGAVSFAKWTAGTTEPKNVEGTTGSIIVMGSITASDDLNGKNLVPYDQDSANQLNESTMATEMTITLGYTVGAEGSATPTITMTASGAVGAKLRYQNGGSWDEFTAGVTVTPGSIKIRLESNDPADMNKAYVITFTAAA